MENQIPDFFAESQNVRHALRTASQNVIFHIMTSEELASEQSLDALYHGIGYGTLFSYDFATIVLSVQ